MRISAAEFVKKFGLLCDEALARPVIITRHGRDRLVVMSLAMYRALGGPDPAKQADRGSVRSSAIAGRKRAVDGRRPLRNR
jgi:prevent-host-death family protein